MPVLLALWRTRELALAHTFRECNGAGSAEIEDILDSTITALLVRSYTSEEHLFRALREGVKMRALRTHRDRSERERILTHTAPVIHAHEQDRAWRDDPERALIAREDDLIISEFLADLTKQEREVFVLIADGRSWRAIATALGLPEWDARALTRGCERKRERFLTLYLTGRLCGYRSRTISNILTGALSGSELALEQALAHLNHCRRCQADHDTTTEELRNAFDHRALALLPAPVLTSAHTGILDRAQALLERPVRLLARITHTHTPGTRERVTEVIAGTSAATKITAGVLGVALLAGATIDISRSLGPPHKTHTPSRAQGPLLTPAGQEGTATTPGVLTGLATGGPLTHTHSSTQQGYDPLPFGPGHIVPYPPKHTARRTVGEQHEPSGFAYLGILARVATAPHIPSSTPGTTTVSRPAHTPIRSSGGPFTP
jgi:DNA-directed RNA polymerase specialized sigma24 family protein